MPSDISLSSSSACLELVHSDIWTSPVSSSSGFRYYILFVDDHSKFTWLYSMHHKQEAFVCFTIFKAHVENLFSTTIKILHIDNGGEFTSKQFTTFLQANGIFLGLSRPHTPQQNGVAERKHRHIADMGRCTLIQHASASLSLWVEAFQTAVFLINRLPTRLLQHKSPFEILF